MYYMMRTSHASPLLNDWPLAAKYDSDNLVITGEMPEDFEGTVDDMSDAGVTNEQLTTAIDAFRVETPSSKICILSKAQGKWLRANHASFMPTPAVN